MTASVQFRPQNRDLGMVMREVDEDLAIFLGMPSAQKEGNDHLAPDESDWFNESKDLQPKPDCSSPLNGTRQHIIPIAAEDSLLNFETEKSDQHWQSDSSSLDLIELNVQHYTANRSKTPKVEAILVKSEVENSSEKSDPSSQDPSTTNTNPSSIPNKKPLSFSGPHKPSPRSSTPTARSTLPAKPGLSRPTLPSSSKPSSKSSTPSRLASRPSTPNSSRPSRPTTSKPGPPPSTPMRGKPGPTAMVSIAPRDPPEAAEPARPISASRGRVKKPKEKPKRPQKSCSPPRMQAQIAGGGHPRGPTALVKVRGGNDDGEDVNPVLMGSKMVDRVVNMRKLPPPKQVECVSRDYSSRNRRWRLRGLGDCSRRNRWTWPYGIWTLEEACATYDTPQEYNCWHSRILSFIKPH